MRMVWAARLGLVVGALALAGPCRADDVPRDGMRAHVDPNTGALRPDGPPLADPAPVALPGPVVEEDAPGGGRMVRLRGRFVSASVVRLDPDGRDHATCVTTDGPSDHASRP